MDTNSAKSYANEPEAFEAACRNVEAYMEAEELKDFKEWKRRRYAPFDAPLV